MQEELIFSPAEFVAVLNQTLEYAYPLVAIEGEISSFKVSKNRWVYFDLKDEEASVRFFGTVYSLPGPLEDGMTVRVIGSPRLHARFGFSVNFQSILPPMQIVQAVEHLNQLSEVPEVLVITRGGGSAEDLSAFNDERVVRAVASSRIPTLVAIGHEVDTSLAELAADQRASTPTNAAQILVPDKKHEQVVLSTAITSLGQLLKSIHKTLVQDLKTDQDYISQYIKNIFQAEKDRLQTNQRLIKLFDPKAVLKRGYALVSLNGKHLKTLQGVKIKDRINIELSDGKIRAEVKEIEFGN
jgi:exonuclease VII large subunit